MRVFLVSICVVALASAGGCGKTTAPPSSSGNTSPGTIGLSQGKPEQSSVRPIITPSIDTVGRAITVNQQARYAVLSYPLGNLPSIGSRVYSYRNGLKTGELRVSGPERENNTVADILSGECQPGDEVRKD